MKRFLKVLEGLVPALAVLGIQLVWGFLFNFLFMMGLTVSSVITSGGKGDIGAIANYISDEILFDADYLYLISLTAILATGVVFAFWYNRLVRFERKVNYKKTLSSHNIILIIALGIGCQFIVSGVMSLFQPYLVDLFDNYTQVIEKIMGANPILVILLTVIIAPISEELIFRGVILKKLNKVLPFLWANIIQAAVFGIYHMNIIQGVYAFGLGIIIGYVAHRCKTIVAPILLHMVVNGSAYLVTFIPDDRIIYLLMILGGLAVIFIALLNINGYSEETNQSGPTYMHW